MQYEVVVTASGKQRGGTILQGTYKGEDAATYSLVDNGTRVVSGPLEPKDIVSTYRIEAGDKKVFRIDDTTKGLGVLKFLKNHPLIRTKGYKNPNLNGPVAMFDLFIESESVEADYKDLTEKIVVIDTVRKMSDTEMRDLSFALGGDPRKMVSKAVYLDLIGTSLNGRAVSEPMKTLTFLKMKSYESVALIYARKAVSYGLAVKEEGIYKINGRTVGSNIEQIAHAFRADSDLFDGFIKREVDKADNEAIKNLDVSKNVFDPNDLPDCLKDIIPAFTETIEAKSTGKITSAKKEPTQQ